MFININRFKFNLIPSIFTLIGLIILSLLGVWQLKRYHYKENLLTEYTQALKQPAVPMASLNKKNDIQFQHVKIRGIFLNDRTIFLDNRFNEDRVGYEVITPVLLTKSNKVILVNRGWVPLIKKSQNPSNLPNINPVFGEQQLTGYIKKIDKHHFILGENILTPNHWPLLIQKINISQIQSILKRPLYPFVIRLDQKSTHGFVRNWQVINVLPQRHLGYAFQWFGLAFVLLITFVIFSRKKNDESGT